jgi:hypothetical protein
MIKEQNMGCNGKNTGLSPSPICKKKLVFTQITKQKKNKIKINRN